MEHIFRTSDEELAGRISALIAERERKLKSTDRRKIAPPVLMPGAPYAKRLKKALASSEVLREHPTVAIGWKSSYMHINSRPMPKELKLCDSGYFRMGEDVPVFMRGSRHALARGGWWWAGAIFRRLVRRAKPTFLDADEGLDWVRKRGGYMLAKRLAQRWGCEGDITRIVESVLPVWYDDHGHGSVVLYGQSYSVDTKRRAVLRKMRELAQKLERVA